MFETFLQRSSTLNLRIRLIILFVVLPNYDCRLASSKFNDLRCNISCPVYRKEKWTLAPLGKASSEIIALLFLNWNLMPTSHSIKSAFEAGAEGYDKFVSSVIRYSFTQRIPVITFVVASSAIFSLLLLKLFLIGIHRWRQVPIQESQADGCWKESPNKAWLIFEYIGVFLAIAYVSAIFMSASVNNFHDNIHLIFTYSTGAMNTSFAIKENIQERYYFNLPDVTNSIPKVIASMNGINFNASNDFIKLIQFQVDAMDYLWRSVATNIQSMQLGLKNDQKKFEYLLNSTAPTVMINTQAYRSTLNALKRVFDEEGSQNTFGPVVDPLL